MKSEPKDIGPYQLLEPLGEGGMGVVWRARHRETGEAAALKTVRVPHSGLLASIRREIHALARLRHPGIVRILGEGIHDGMPWYAMQILEGLTLQEWKGARSSQSGINSESTIDSGSTIDSEATIDSELTIDSESTIDSELTIDSWSTIDSDSDSPLDATRPMEPIPPSASAPELSPHEIPEPSQQLTEEMSNAFLPDLALMRKLCHALSYLHGEGLVHRDLKPQNILVLPDGQPVLVDFGLAARTGGEVSREALEVAGLVSGTASYMAPEQARGDGVDARADLYALGCILYELLTGRPPFQGSTLAEVLYGHLQQTPSPPSRLQSAVPPELDRLVLRLLEKEPRRRLGYADDVAVALSHLTQDLPLSCELAVLDASGMKSGDEESAPARLLPVARPYLYRPGFCGRQDELALLRTLLADLRSGHGGAMLAAGESGVGKTRLLVELSRLASQERVRVLTGECLPPTSSADLASGSAPLQAFRKILQTVADRCRERGEKETERLLGQQGKVLGVYEPALAGLKWLQDQPDPPALPAGAARARLYSRLVYTLLAMTDEFTEGNATKRTIPLLLLLDDLQWADELSLGALDSLVSALAARRAEEGGIAPLLVVGVYRADETSPALRKLAERPEVTTLKLERLGGPEVGRIVSDMLGLAAPPQSFARFLQQQSEGNPFFVAEYLRAAVEQGLLYRDPTGTWQVGGSSDEHAAEEGYSGLPLPHSVLELVGERLARISPDAQRLVHALAVLGREADGGLLADVAGLESAEVMKATVEVLSCEILEAEGDRLRFAHDKLREVAYTRLGEETRRNLHRSAAEGLEDFHGENKGEVLGALARHWERAGEPVRSAPYHLAAGRQEAERYALHDAEAHLRAYLRLTPNPSIDTLKARLTLGETVLVARGQLQQAEEVLAEGIASASAVDGLAVQGQLLGALGNLYRISGRMDEARTTLERALDLHRRSNSLPGQAAVLGNLAVLYRERGLAEEARPCYEEALRLFRELGALDRAATVMVDLAVLHQQQGQVEEARRTYEDALVILRKFGNRRYEAAALANLGGLHQSAGRLEEAIPLFEHSLLLFRQVGERRGEGSLLSLLGSAYLDRGQLDEARRALEQALSILRQIGDRRTEASLLGNLALLHQRQGEVTEALERYEQAVALHGLEGNQRYELPTVVNLAAFHREQGRLDDARQVYESALSLIRQIGDQEQEMKVMAAIEAIDR